MHIVYKITFSDRKENKQYPFYYIGSKSNCKYVDGKIIGSNNKEYYGSSRHKDYQNSLEKESNLIIEILAECSSFNEALEKESYFQKEYDVVKSKEYFNLSIAPQSTYTSPDYITVKHKEHGKICRIHKDELDEDWIGVSKGRKWYNNGSISKTFYPDFVPDGWVLGRIGDFSYSSNNFLKNNSKEELIKKSVEKRLENGSYTAWNKGITCDKATDETKQKMRESHKKRKELGKYINPSQGKRWCNNGTSNLLIQKDLPLPNGYTYGQLKNKKS